MYRKSRCWSLCTTTTSWAATTPLASAGLAMAHQGLGSATGQTCWPIPGVQWPSGTLCNQKRKWTRLSRPQSVKWTDRIFTLSHAWKGRLPLGIRQPWSSYSDGLTLKGTIIIVSFTVSFMLKCFGHMTTCVLFILEIFPKCAFEKCNPLMHWGVSAAKILDTEAWKDWKRD